WLPSVASSLLASARPLRRRAAATVPYASLVKRTPVLISPTTSTHSPPPSTLRISAPCPSCRSAGADLGTRACCAQRSPSEVTMGIGPWLGVAERYRCSGSSVALFGLLLNDGG